MSPDRFPLEAMIDVLARASESGELSRDRAIGAASLLAIGAPPEIALLVQRRFRTPTLAPEPARLGGRWYSVKDAAPMRGQSVDALRAEIRRSPQVRADDEIRVELGGGWYAARSVHKKVWRIWIPLGGAK